MVQINPNDSKTIVDAITYPGITDALNLQGAITDNPDYLYTSEYYTWDPFVDFDKFVNYAQYYWVPQGPASVNVAATGVPLSNNFTVTRTNGFYTFSGVSGNDPTVTLVKGGSYTFNIAQNNQATIQYRVVNNGTSSWAIDYEANPTLTLVRGNTYEFILNQTTPLQFYIKTELSFGNVNLWNEGVLNNGATSGTLTFTVPQDAPDILYYCNPVEFNLRGQLNIVNGTAGTGPGFWIQTDPGISGTIPATPNISSRSVLGVTNNGTDLGTVTFDVPLSDAQNFYYDLNSIGSVDLLTNLQFAQINNQFVDNFFATNPTGIDGITNINGRTVVFQTNNSGWEITTNFDPLADSSFNGQVGSFDSVLFDQTTPVTDQRYSVWQIQYITNSDNRQYISLVSVLPVNDLEKFTILFGTQWSNTQWYKDSSGYFEQIPLLTASKTVLFYQDGTDPNMFGEIKLLEESNAATLNISDIVGHKNYTSPNGVVFTNGLKVAFRGSVNPSSYQNNEYYVEGVGIAIKLLPVTEFVTPESYIAKENATISNTSPLVPDYITINRASIDQNPWTRSNRWFHINVINATAAYNNTVPVLDNNFRARRPVLEFRANTQLFDFGTEGKSPVNIVDFTENDALRNVNGTIGYSTDGYTLVAGSRIIFAADLDPVVRNTIYVVEFIIPDTVPPLIPEPIIVLTPASDATVLVNQSVLSLDGNTSKGLTYYYDGINWINAQQKISVNQPPQFNIYDINGISFGDNIIYPSTNFRGSSLFSYAIGSGPADLVLGFPLTYLNLDNIGDIVFDNNLYADSFSYTVNNAGQTVAISTGFVRQYINRTAFIKEIGWQTGATESLIRQQFQFVYDGTPSQLDVAVSASTIIPAVQVFINATFQESYNYRISTTSNTTTITWLTKYIPGDLIEISVLSDQVSATGFFQVPINLENNPLNGNSSQFTLGSVRNHYSTIAQNLIQLNGPVIGANNTRDLGNIVPYGLQILQQSSPLTLTGYFMRDINYDIFASLEYNNKEYTKFKSLLLDTVINNDYGTMTVPQILNAAIAQINASKTNLNSFYWSDMLPTSTVFTSTTTIITPITTSVFNTVQTYDFLKSNYLGLLVYLNDRLLTRGYDYIVSAEGPTLTILIPLAIGDTVTINEYTTTLGNFVPNTPTKLGLYPKFKPEIFIDTNYINPTVVIQGHDGSITVAFSDIRDQILLEFENRIFNNLKTDDNPVPLTADEVIPGFFRSTDYSQAKITQILGESFLNWVGWNKLDYKQQNFIALNPFTYNYSSAGNRINGQPLLGAWRGIYRYFYDTTSPNLTPWEMLGFSEKPAWWEQRYGPVPYTSDNLVLWGDLEAGYIADPVVPYINPLYARPGLTSVIPVNGQGQLLDPLKAVAGQVNPTAFRKSWVVGDGGPTEAAWWSSSSYPFAIMRLLALTRPAKFFSLFADRDLYRYNTDIGQYLYNNRYRINATDLQLYGSGVSKASYIDWIIDYNKQLGVDSTAALTLDLANLDVRLCYRVAAFTDKQYVNIYLEKSSPESQNSSLLLPPESYNLFLYKNQPFDEIIYSSLIIEQLNNGQFSVYGYSNTQPYFPIFVSSISGPKQTITAGNTVVQVPTQYTNNIAQIPYGYAFANATTVVDFILSYGALLTAQGMTFNTVENGYVLSWSQMAQEFLYWANQGWQPGTIINLNPGATQISAYRPGAVVDTIISYTPENMLLDQNKNVVATRNLIVQRDGDSFSVASTTNQTISFLQLRFTNYEDIIILDNVSIFNDLIYDPITAERQNRINWSANISTEWNGILNAQGFILNQPNVLAWNPNQKYTKGEIVIYKNSYWSALSIIQPQPQFQYSNWVKSNYALISPGLLPNIANKSVQQANSYNTYNANLASDNDLLAYGLIGFRPRQYMVDLNLDDVSQVNLYQQFIGTKGTNLSVELFTRADFGKEAGQYTIFENWAVLVGTYGANAVRSFVELQLNQALLTGNPSTIQIIQPGYTSQADQTIFVNNLWSESYKITSPDIFPTTYNTNLDVALPTAGYVNVNDADITVFNLNDPSNISANISNIGIGTTIWVAQINSYDWNIYRCSAVSGRLLQVSNNLNGSSVAKFNNPHGLAIGDLVIIKYFDASIDGVYRILSVPSPTSVVIAYTFTNSTQTQINGNGIVFYLQSMRVAQASDIANLSYATSLLPGARAWVDNDGNGKWEVLEKQDPFTVTALLTPFTLYNNSLFGSSISQSSNHFSVLVGAPGVNSGSGAIYSYRQAQDNTYTTNLLITLTATDAAGYGNSLDFGQQTWAVAGASTSNTNAGYVTTLYQTPGTNNFLQTQLLVEPTQNFSAINFGYAVTISYDERWMYISAPGANKVYAYALVQEQEQSVTYTTDGITSIFNWSNAIMVDPAEQAQLVVTLGRTIQVYGRQYQLIGNSIQFFITPVAGQTLVISRQTSVQLDQNIYYNVAQNSTSGSGVNSIFVVDNTRGVYQVTLVSGGSGYALGDTLTIDYTQIAPTGSSANDLVITVTATTIGTITEFSYTGSGVTNTSTFNLSNYLYTATNIYAFTVVVDDVLQRPYIDYTFNSGTTLVFLTVPTSGAIIQVTSNSYWNYVSTITVDGLGGTANFGTSITTSTDGRQIIIGAPNDSAINSTGESISYAGAVYAFDRSVVRYIINNVAQTTYVIPGSYTQPVAVLLNGAFLTNSAQYINGQFTQSGSNIILSSLVILTVGDTLEIETNQFNLLEKLVANKVQTASAFGQAVTVCPFDCSIYVGAPLYTTQLPQAGIVERWVNQSKLYGVTTSTIANPNLTSGNTIRINDVEITLPGSTIQSLVDAINNYNNGTSLPVGIPNVIASLTSDVILVGDGTTQVFNIGNIYSTATDYSTVVYVDSTLQTDGVDYTYNNIQQQLIFVIPPAMASIIKVVSGRMTISVKNSQSADPRNMVTVLPGATGTAFTDIGFTTFVWTQDILSPNQTQYAQFGSSIGVNTGATNLVVGAPNGTVYEPVTFDQGNTYFDEHSTTFFNLVLNSGVCFTFDLLPSASTSVNDPGLFVFGQQLYNTGLIADDRDGNEIDYLFGFAVNYRDGRLVIGAPGSDAIGEAYIFNNPTNSPAWAIIHAQQPTVDVALLDSVYSYDKLLNSTQTYYDFIDPLQGKILGAARRNIDYIGAVDPAYYNIGSVHNTGNFWGANYVGEIWWDTNRVRFIDPNQDNIVYASRRWGQVFPGSNVDIYQWIESSVTPVNYTGPGIPLSTISYSVSTSLNINGIFVTSYYFWVRGLTSINTDAGKNLSTTGIASYILNPIGSGIPYIAGINASTIAIYNANSLLSGQDTILHIGFDREATTANIHTEYAFIADGRPQDFLNPLLYRKLQDSFCGVDTSGQLVPDTTLSIGEQYGVQFRPRQSMFSDRFAALQNYLGRANTVLLQYPISETRSFNLLNSAEPIPAEGSGAWDMVVPNLEILGYQNLVQVPLGYTYLVLSDSSQFGLWTIYKVATSLLPGQVELQLVRIQNYDTTLYWTYVNWYLPGYNSTIQPIATVQNYAGLSTLSLIAAPIGSSVKVSANSQGKFEIYLRIDTGWQRVELQDGTIQFDATLWDYALGNFGFDAEVFDAQYFDKEPVIETRQIIRAINEELFIDELLIERNSALILMFNFIYSEFTAPNWLLKTSFIDVDHKIRQLLPYQYYLKDNQTFVLDYLQEVKPYHTQILQFNLIYNGIDSYSGNLTDFDVPAYWDSNLSSKLIQPQFISPILTPYTSSNSHIESTVSDAAANTEVWTLEPWSQWFNNYLLQVQSISIVNGGTGYTIPPTVIITGTCTTPATGTAIINYTGQVIAVIITDPGYGYVTTAQIALTEGTGSGARAVAVMGNNLVRSFKTVIKYDRYQYSSTIVEWQPNVIYTTGTQVRYANVVWSAISTVSSATFIPDQWQLVDAGTLSGVNRTMGYYTPGPDQPGLNLPLLISGVDYPGVQVSAPGFVQNTGFDINGFDINPFDNLFYGPEGLPTYDPGILDTAFSSAYLDLYLGTRATDINVAGGAYVDAYSSHAPEELIPGAEFDTLDFRVYTTPGADWLGRGHGFPFVGKRYTYDPANPVAYFGDLLPFPMVILTWNITTGLAIEPSAYDWVNYNFTLTQGAQTGNIIQITVVATGGGNQLMSDTYIGSDIGNTIIIPFPLSAISGFVIYDGEYGPLASGADYTYAAYTGNNTQITFSNTYGATDRINLTCLGYAATGSTHSWSLPVFQTIIITNTVVLATSLQNGYQYQIKVVGTTDFTLIGAPNNNIGTIFTATGPGVGTGTAFDLAAIPLTYPLTNSLQGTNIANIIVLRNGARLRPAEGVNYISNGVQITYNLPSTGGYNQSLIADTDVTVYVNNQKLILNVDYVVNAYNILLPRTITLVRAPAIASTILISVSTAAQYTISNNSLTFNPASGVSPQIGDIIEIITWNDTSEQHLLTQVWVGPITNGTIITQPFDSTFYDEGDISGDTGSYDYSNGFQSQINVFNIGTPIINAERLLVTLNGKWLFYGYGYTTSGPAVIITGPAIGIADVVVITSFSQYAVPEAMAFRIFQDMRGIQSTYRITPDTTTNLLQSLGATDDIIYVTDATRLSEPEFSANLWGALTVNGERIMYRFRDTTNNTVSSLLRGTAGTAAAPHAIGAAVYNIGLGNLLPAEYQNYIVLDKILANGTTTVFTAANIIVDNADEIEVYIGGTLQSSGYTITTINPVTVTFTNAPADGVEVDILVRRGVTWYAPGVDTASNGVPLQETDTQAARFLRGI